MDKLSRREQIALAFQQCLATNPNKAPSAGDIQRALGEPVKNGGDLNGRDVATLRELCQLAGFVKAENGRWTRGEETIQCRVRGVAVPISECVAACPAPEWLATCSMEWESGEVRP
jgi:hypothetical protein